MNAYDENALSFVITRTHRQYEQFRKVKKYICRIENNKSLNYCIFLQNNNNNDE